MDILKDEWGFEGLVVSDWGAVHDRIAALKGGLDLEMPGPKDHRVKAVVEAVRTGELDEAVLNESVRRILGIVFKATETPKGGEFDVAAHHALALINCGGTTRAVLELAADIQRQVEETFGIRLEIEPVVVAAPS